MIKRLLLCSLVATFAALCMYSVTPQVMCMAGVAAFFVAVGLTKRVQND